jgi:hypothetical protein
MLKDEQIMENNVVDQFGKTDISDFPDFYAYNSILEQGLWILWVAKEKLGIRKLSSYQIVSIMREVMEVSVTELSISRAFSRGGTKVHIYRDKPKRLFEIMKSGKDFLLSKAKGSMQLYYFEPNKPFTSKRVLSKNILENICGELGIVDPYCSERTLDILKEVPKTKIRFLTKIDNLKGNKQNRFLRELAEFKKEYGQNVEFRDYPHTDIHDRYIVTSDSLVILGHGIKDLGNKESFAIVFNKAACANITEALLENFNRRWKESKVL